MHNDDGTMQSGFDADLGGAQLLETATITGLVILVAVMLSREYLNRRTTAN